MTDTRREAIKRSHDEKLQREKLSHDSTQKEADRQAAERREHIKGRYGVASATIKGVSNLSGAAMKAANSPDWYKRWPLGKGVGFQIPTWNRFQDLGGFGESYMYCDDTNTESYPTLMLFRYIPCIGNQLGRATNGHDVPAIFAMNYVMTKMRELNSRIGDYEPITLFAYLIAATEVHAAIAELVRLSRLCHVFNDANAYEGSKELAAYVPFVAGITGEDIKNWVKTNILKINALIQDANMNCIVPDDFSLLKRRVWLNSNVFKDSSVRMAQKYAFVTEYLGVFDAQSDAILYNKKNYSSYLGLDGYIAYIQYCINQIKEQAEFVTIQSDMRNAYKGKFYACAPLSDDEGLEVHDIDEVKAQIHNMVMMPNIITGDPVSTSVHFRIDRTTGYVYQGTATTGDEVGIKFSLTGYFAGTGNSISSSAPYAALQKTLQSVNVYSFSDEMNEDSLLVGTRLKPVLKLFSIGGTAPTALHVMSAGTEIIKDAIVVNYNIRANSLLTTTVTNFYIYDVDSANTDGHSLEVYVVKGLLAFDWSPVIINFQFDTDDLSVGNNSTFVIGDTGNVYHMDIANLTNIHYYAVTSEYITIPSGGTFR